MNQDRSGKDWDLVFDLANAFEKAIRDSDEPVRRKLMHALLYAFDVLLIDPARRYEYPVFNQAAEYVSSAVTEYRLHPYDVWDWLRRVARSADEHRKIAMTIAIFKPWVEDIDWDSRDEWNLITPLFQLYSDPELQWVLIEAFDDRPKQLLAEYNRFLMASKKFVD